MGDNAEDEDLFDVDGDDFAADTLTDLEHHAALTSQPQHARHGDAHEGTEMDVEQQQFIAPSPPSSDYGFDDDEDVIDLDDPTADFRTNIAPFLNAAGSTVNHQQAIRPAVQPPGDDNGPHEHRQVDSPQLQELQSRLAELEEQHARLNASLEEARTEALTKNGAISNLRSRNERTVKDYEARIAAITKQHHDDVTKLRAEIQSAKENQASLKIDKRFMEHELAEERQRAKRTKQALPDARAALARAPDAVTPRKSKSASYRDGFDDHEIVNLSPTKPRDKKQSPLKNASKRKWSGPDSPQPAAPSVHGSPLRKDSFERSQRLERDHDLDALALATMTIRDEHMDIMRAVLGHRVQGHQQRTVEELGQHKFPGNADITLQTTLLDTLSRVQASDAEPSSVSVRRVCLDLWEQCVACAYWEPLALILDLFDFMLQHEASGPQILLCERLLRLASRTGVKVAEPRVSRPSSQPARQSSPVKTPADEAAHARLVRCIDDTAILSIVRTVAVSASLKPERAATFWTAFDFSFAILMSHIQQPLPLIHIMLDMLAVSVTEDSFGPRHADHSVQVRQEHDLLERLCNLLSETPSPGPASSPPLPSPTAIQAMRMHVLHVLRAISATVYGSKALVANRHVLGRLARFLCDQISSLYLQAPIVPLLAPSATSSESHNDNACDDAVLPSAAIPKLHAQTTAAVNLAVRILHHLFVTQPFVLRDRLEAAATGTYNKGLIALARLAFISFDNDGGDDGSGPSSSRGGGGSGAGCTGAMLLEAGIDEGAAQAAHAILDAALTPEDGEAVLVAMAGGGEAFGEEGAGVDGDGDGDGDGDAETVGESMNVDAAG